MAVTSSADREQHAQKSHWSCKMTRDRTATINTTPLLVFSLLSLSPPHPSSLHPHPYYSVSTTPCISLSPPLFLCLHPTLHLSIPTPISLSPPHSSSLHPYPYYCLSTPFFISPSLPLFLCLCLDPTLHLSILTPISLSSTLSRLKMKH